VEKYKDDYKHQAKAASAQDAHDSDLPFIIFSDISFRAVSSVSVGSKPIAWLCRLHQIGGWHQDSHHPAHSLYGLPQEHGEPSSDRP
jgi:hypothetical protein